MNEKLLSCPPTRFPLSRLCLSWKSRRRGFKDFNVTSLSFLVRFIVEELTTQLNSQGSSTTKKNMMEPILNTTSTTKNNDNVLVVPDIALGQQAMIVASNDIAIAVGQQATIVASNDIAIVSNNKAHRAASAFVLGIVLAILAWIANQAWTVLSLVLFGPFDWSSGTAWKHLFFCSVGSITTSVVWFCIFSYFFPEHDNNDNNAILPTQVTFKRDVVDALQDLGELGFVVGYLSAQFFGMKLLAFKHFTISYNTSSGFDGAIMVMLVVWVFFTKIKDYMKAVKRVKYLEDTDELEGLYYIQCV